MGTEYTITVKAIIVADEASGSSNEIRAWTRSTVSFNYNYSGVPTATTQEVASGQKVQSPTSPPNRLGYAIMAGNTTADGSGTDFDFGKIAIMADLTLYAK